MRLHLLRGQRRQVRRPQTSGFAPTAAGQVIAIGAPALTVINERDTRELNAVFDSKGRMIRKEADENGDRRIG